MFENLTLKENKENFFELCEKWKGEIMGDVQNMLMRFREDNPGKIRLEPGYKYEVDGRKYVCDFSSGKQQPVYIISISINGVEEQIVYRSGNIDFEKIYNTNEVVKKYFPKIIAAEENGPRKNYLLETIRGYEEKKDFDEFQFRLVEKKFFDKMCSDFFLASDEILNERLMLSDLNPLSGQNFMFNKEEDRFMFFDIDTINYSEFSLQEKYFYFLKDATSQAFQREEESEKELGVQFVLDLFTRVIDKYGRDFFKFSSDPEKFRSAALEKDVTLREPNVEYKEVTMMDENYPKLREALKFGIMRKYGSEDEYPVIIISEGVRVETRWIDDGFIDAILEKNINKLKSEYLSRGFKELIHRKYDYLPAGEE